MIVVTPEQMKYLEAEADRNGNSYENLMELAGKKLSEKITEMLCNDKQKKVLFLCGNGNNAGDCFVAARYLENTDICCTVAMLCGTPKTDISLLNFNRMRNTEIISEHREIMNALRTEKFSLAADGVFGTGFRGELPEKICEVFAACADLKILAVDVPSGGNCKTGAVSIGTLKADETITFAFSKFGMTQYPLKSFCGKVCVADIGIHQKFTENLDCIINITDNETIKGIIPQKVPDSHKGNYGRLLTVCGSETMPGACIMSLESALKSGVGLVQAAVPESLIQVIATRLPEVMFLPLTTDSNGCITFDNFDKIIRHSKNATSVLIGCGIGVTEQTKTLVKNLIANINCPVILDADGINCIADSIDIIKQSMSDIIITPHPAEMGRLCNVPTGEIQSDRLQAALEFAKENNVTVVLKGAGTVIAGNNRVNVNTNGNPGMAKGGSGDVLAGIIASLKAQGISAYDSAVLGTFIHGLAGDEAASEMSMQSMTATDIIKKLSMVFKTCTNGL
ncbi:MAG: NAD(P)H-hydrate dehydratase [Oscillospiraceae bacterium]|nr:NAD(P)H-hydrate dehydratase [Oscillospiraceae bacterium]